MLLRHAQEMHRAPGGFVGEADRADLAFPDQHRKRLERLVQVVEDARRVLPARVIGPALAEMVGTAVRPVQLVEIDVVRPQSPEASCDRVAQAGGGDRCPLADPRPPGPGDLRRKHHVAAPAGRREPAADAFFRPPLGFRRGRVGGVHLRRVEEIDALRESVVHLPMRLRLAVLVAPVHRAEADLAHLDAGAAELLELHVSGLAVCSGRGDGGAGYPSSAFRQGRVPRDREAAAFRHLQKRTHR